MFSSYTANGVRYSSMGPVLFNNEWVVKASTTDHGVICLVLFNVHTLEVIVRFFDDEDQANLFLRQTVDIY